MRINYDFGDLEAFLAVMDAGSFHGAAGRIALSQPAITRRVQKLEEVLGSQLFERTTRSVRPTLAAKRLQARAQALVADAQEMGLAMRDESLLFAHQRNQIVTVATVPTMISWLLAPAMDAFRAKGHGARVRIVDLAANEVAEAVAQGDADFGLSALPSHEPNTVFTPLYNDRIVAVAWDGHRLAGRDDLTWADLAGEAIIVPAKSTGNRLLIDDALAATRQSVRWMYEARRSTTALDLVRAKLGVALLPRWAVARDDSADFATFDLRDPEIVRPAGMLTRFGPMVSETAAVLCAEVTAVAGRL